MRIELREEISTKLRVLALRRGVTPPDLVRHLIGVEVAGIEVQPGEVEALDRREARPPSITGRASEVEKCLCPPCPDFAWNRGLCPKHYQRVRYFMGRRKLEEGWLVRHGRLLPYRGRTVDDYAVSAETLDTLPWGAPNAHPENVWLFGGAETEVARANLEARVKGGV